MTDLAGHLSAMRCHKAGSSRHLTSYGPLHWRAWADGDVPYIAGLSTITVQESRPPSRPLDASPEDPVGPTGPAGPVAPVDPTAPLGPAGPSGPVGPAGPARPAGPVGPSGPSGSRGSTCARGPGRSQPGHQPPPAQAGPVSLQGSRQDTCYSTRHRAQRTSSFTADRLSSVRANPELDAKASLRLSTVMMVQKESTLRETVSYQRPLWRQESRECQARRQSRWPQWLRWPPWTPTAPKRSPGVPGRARRPCRGVTLQPLCGTLSIVRHQAC